MVDIEAKKAILSGLIDTYQVCQMKASRIGPQFLHKDHINQGLDLPMGCHGKASFLGPGCCVIVNNPVYDTIAYRMGYNACGKGRL